MFARGLDDLASWLLARAVRLELRETLCHVCSAPPSPFPHFLVPPLSLSLFRSGLYYNLYSFFPYWHAVAIVRFSYLPTAPIIYCSVGRFDAILE